MTARQTDAPRTSRLRDMLLRGYEPAPAGFIARQAYYPWIVVGTTCIGAFIGQLDASIVQLALPALEHEFNASLSAVSWVAIAYLLAFAAVLPVFARLSEIIGRKLLYLIGFGLFTLGSALCALASDLMPLIGFRILQGIGGAMLGANSITILYEAAGARRRAEAMGLFAAAQAVGVSAGPAVGGLLLDVLGWRSIFWVTVPFGLAGVAMGWLVVPQTGDLADDKRFDWPGALLLVPGLTSMILVLSELHAWGPTSPALITGAIAAVIFISLFIWREHRAAAPVLDLHLLRVVTFCCGSLAAVLAYALLYVMFFLMSFAFLRGYHYSPIAAGLELAIIPVALGITAPISGALYDRLGPRVLTVTGMVFCLAAITLLSTALSGTSTSAGVEIALALFGVGLGAFIAPNNNSTMAAAPTDRAGEAGGLLNLMRVLGTSLGVAAGSSMLSWQLQLVSGSGHRTLGSSSEDLLEAVMNSLVVPAGFAVIAGLTSLARSHVRRQLAARPA
jgi:EmrB/QacA subfamily drug resistance transporter